MFTVTAKGIYGLTAMVELAKTYHQGSRQIREIAETHAIPQHYLEQILVTLKKAGIVESFRGARGGYALARSPDRIKLIDILGLLEGKLEVIPDQHKNNELGFFWMELEESLRSSLDRSLEELLLAQQNDQNRIFYAI